MPQSLLDSQFATLEVPDLATENALHVPVTDPVDKIVRTVTGTLEHLKTFRRWQ
jgi:gluconokinase